MNKKRLFFRKKADDDQFFPNLEFAFSFKKRVVTATLCLRIRRSNDDAETDLLLESTGEVDINSLVSAGGTLSAWIGSNDGYMVTDYDQTGNGYDMTQLAKPQQARIVTAGVWNGFKDYSVGNCVYFSSSPCLLEIGSVYVKADKATGDVLYYISQAKSGDARLLSLSTQFESPNNKLRILDFTPTFNQIRGNNFMNVGININTYKSNGAPNGYQMRLNSVNQILTIVSGTHTGNWFNDYSFAGFTLQKGALIWTVNLYRDYKEYEMLSFNVLHNDAESLEIENTM